MPWNLTPVRHVLRTLAKTPIFTITAIASLAVGIGASSVIFSAGNGLIFAPTPGIREMSRLVDIGRSTGGSGFDTVSYPTFTDVRDKSSVFSGVYAMRLGPEPMSLGVDGGSERIYGEEVSGGYFDVLGVAPAMGAVFHAAGERADVPLRTIVLSHGFWRRQFAGDASVVGRTVTLNSETFTIIGVTPEPFRGTTILTPDIWVPLTAFAKGMPQPDMVRMREASWLIMGARLKPDVSIEQARQAMAALASQQREAYPEIYRDRGLAVVAASRVPGHAVAYGVPMLALLLGLAGLVLLVACANLAGLLLTRVSGRSREIAIRLALGASRRSIFSLLIVESLALALAGGLAALAFVFWVRPAIESLSSFIPIPTTLAVATDWRVLTFTTGLTIITALAIGALPAWHASRGSLLADLKADSMAPARKRLRHLFVAAQFGFCAVLVAVSGLFARAVGTAASVNPGLHVEGIDVVSLNFNLAGYSADARPRVAEEVRSALATIPGVRSAGISRLIPLQGSTIGYGGLRRPGETDERAEIEADWNSVSPDYMATVGIPVLRGRAFSAVDRAGGEDVAVVNERLAALAWPGADPLGRVLEAGDLRPGRGSSIRRLTIVGVVRDSRSQWIGETPGPFIYVPFAQWPSGELNYLVHRDAALGDDSSLHRAIRGAVRAYNPNLPVIDIAPLSRHAGLGLLPQRAAAAVASVMGVIALLLAAIGVHGVVAYTVASRTREIGVRVALGAVGSQIMWTVLRQSLLVVSIGGLLGLAASVGVGQLARSLLFGVSPLDPIAFAGATAVLVAMAALAALLPARRATRINPVEALRAE